MKPTIHVLLVLAGTVASNCPARESALLDSLALVETGASSSQQCKADFKRGSAGEVSRYQIKPGVWRRYAANQRYTDPATARRIAAQVLNERMRVFWVQYLRAPSPFEVYVLWNAPAYLVGEWKGKTISRPLSERAQRYANLVNAQTGSSARASAHGAVNLSYVLADSKGTHFSLEPEAHPPRRSTVGSFAD